MSNYTNEMYRCIELAKQAAGKTSPNPMVGCVILNDKGEIISEGFHKKYGQNHAERDALLKIENAKECTLVVNLEPCCHHGKTPPCTDIIIAKGVKRVVYGMKDPNPMVSGKGINALKNAGIDIIGEVLEEECRSLNEVFIKNQTQHKTFIALKTATTIDGKIATKNGDSKWITSENARNRGKELRQKYDAILTSSSTILADNPNMQHKTKIILDRELKTNINSNIYKDGEIYVFYDGNNKIPDYNNPRIKYIPTPVNNMKMDIKYILDKVYEYGIMSIFAETGGTLSTSLLPFTDKIYQFIAPKILADNSGKSCFEGRNTNLISDCYEFEISDAKLLKNDVLITYKRKSI